jgi:hypothetical protein
MKKNKRNRSASKTRKATAATKVAPQTAAGRARAEGLRLFKLASKPTREQVVHVFGDSGVAWTWAARAKAVGMKSGEEVARRFPELLKKPSGSSLVPRH